jgi:hypothetical protein
MSIQQTSSECACRRLILPEYHDGTKVYNINTIWMVIVMSGITHSVVTKRSNQWFKAIESKAKPTERRS